MFLCRRKQEPYEHWLFFSEKKGWIKLQACPSGSAGHLFAVCAAMEAEKRYNSSSGKAGRTATPTIYNVPSNIIATGKNMAKLIRRCYIGLHPRPGITRSDRLHRWLAQGVDRTVLPACRGWTKRWRVWNSVSFRRERWCLRHNSACNLISTADIG